MVDSTSFGQLTPVEFQDALSLRYKRPLVRMTPTCDGFVMSSEFLVMMVKFQVFNGFYTAGRGVW